VLQTPSPHGLRAEVANLEHHVRRHKRQHDEEDTQDENTRPRVPERTVLDQWGYLNVNDPDLQPELVEPGIIAGNW